MKKRRSLVLSAIGALSLLLVTGLPAITSSVALAESNKKLLISAAASLKEVLTEIKQAYQKSHPNVKINYNFGASGLLERQIEQGAPVDLFVSAAKKQIDNLDKQGILLPGTTTVIVKNKLVLIVPKNVIEIHSFYQLKDAKVKKIVIGEPKSVPAGQYAAEVLKSLKIWPDIQSKLVYANNVRQVLASVESGNADAGLVYLTDAKISSKVRIVVGADEKYHSAIVYPLAVIKSSKNINAAKEFSQFLSSNQAKAYFRKYGFIVP